MTTLAVPARAVRVDEARATYGAWADTYVAALGRTDPLADDAAADLAAMSPKQSRQVLEAALLGDLADAPASLVRLLDAMSTPPAWLDPDLADRGARAYVRFPRGLALSLGLASLVSSYNNPSANLPLTWTKRFVEMAPLRAYETGTWLFAATRPGGLERSAPGFARTVRVRLVHARVRRLLLATGEWDVEADGAPINQADTAYTVIEFSLIALDAMKQLGLVHTASELDAIYHLWRWIGHLMGVDDDVLPVDEATSRRMFASSHLLSPEPDQGSRDLVHAMVDGPGADAFAGLVRIPALAPTFGRWLAHGFARAFTGDELSDAYALDRSLARFAPRVLAPLNRVGTALTDRLLPGDATPRHLRALDLAIAEQAKVLGVGHDLVDAAG